MDELKLKSYFYELRGQELYGKFINLNNFIGVVFRKEED